MEQLKSMITSPKLWVSVLIVAAAVVLWRIVRHSFMRYIKKETITAKKRSSSHFIMNLTKYAIFVIMIITVLQINGIDVSSLITGLGVVSIIVGFALQDILKDVVMGANIIADDYFKTGDAVRYEGIEVGTVVYFNMKATKILDHYTNNVITVSNRNISKIEKISNQLNIVLPFPYEVKPETARAVCKEICEAAQKAENIKDCRFMGTENFAQSALEYMLFVTCKPEKRYEVRREVLGITQDIFEQNHIAVPYPQLDVHLKEKG